MKKRLLTVICALLLLCGCTRTEKLQNIIPQETETPVSADTMTIEDKVAQMLIACCCGADMDPILDKHPGGILLFSVDFDDLSASEVKEKINGFTEGAVIKPYIAVDEEGGTVVRVSSHSALVPKKYESPRYYYTMGGISAIIDNTKEKSQLLRSLGINMNLAPVADISQDPNDFMYERSLGADAATTAEYVSAVVQTSQKHGIAACLKHFPGYGGNVDTHTGIAVDDRSLDRFRANDFLPFSSGIAAGCTAVLVSHNIITAVDDTEPASISPEIHNILRDELGFNGIIITDDMSMGAMEGYDNAYARAVLAGNDMLIVSDFQAAYNEILAAVEDGTIPTDMIDTAVNRIITMKK